MAREQHHGRAFRRLELVCGRIAVTVVRDDERLGLAQRERSYVIARFAGDLDPSCADSFADEGQPPDGSPRRWNRSGKE